MNRFRLTTLSTIALDPANGDAHTFLSVAHHPFIILYVSEGYDEGSNPSLVDWPAYGLSDSSETLYAIKVISASLGFTAFGSSLLTSDIDFSKLELPPGPLYPNAGVAAGSTLNAVVLERLC